MIEYIQFLLENYGAWAPFIFFIARMLPIVAPPIPGLAIDFIGLNYFDPFTAFFIAEISTLVASGVAFYIGRIFREPIVKRFVPLQKIHTWEDAYSEKQKFWKLVGIRFITSPFFDYMGYIAGLTKMHVSTYLMTTFLGTLPIMIFIYAGGGVIQYQFGIKGLIIAFIFAAIFSTWLGWFLWKRRKRK